MARRMIRARHASPYMLYLVIAFAILTVAGWILAAWMYTEKEDTLRKVFGEQTLRTTKDTTALWNDLLQTYKDDGSTLVEIIESKEERANVFRNEIQHLAERLSGDPLTNQYGEELRQSVADVLKATNDMLITTEQELQRSYTVGRKAPPADVRPTSMVTAIRALVQRVDALGRQIQQDDVAINDLKAQIKGLNDQLQTAQAEHKRQVAQVQQELQDEKERLTKARQSAEDTAKTIKEDNKRLQDRMLQDQRAHAKEVDELKSEVTKLQNHLKDLSEVVKRFREVPTETGVDGRIVSVAQQEQVAFGDLGKKDGVLLGMTFSIFGPGELGKTEPTPKAECRIVKIMDNACELRIYEIQGDNPVVAGDVLHNPVYDRQRRMRFVLVGKMDTDGDGFDDSEELKALIQEFGGRIDPELTVQADFLVVGEEPPVPAPPAPAASPQEVQAYQQSRQKFIAYTEAKARAENFSIPILNLNRFLGLVGIAGQT